mmetsp:Transcript_11985/g.13398  ORF Transcript_11985/g.13398 Transcript_11985/m.13398 type:complete len:84 (-) Transcript_11985:11-262(-)
MMEKSDCDNSYAGTRNSDGRGDSDDKNIIKVYMALGDIGTILSASCDIVPGTILFREPVYAFACCDTCDTDIDDDDDDDDKNR